MGRSRFFALLLLTSLGCTTAVQERVRQFNDDGVHQFSRGNYNHARDSFEMALTLEPNNVPVLFNLAQCHDRMGSNDKAEAYYRDCLERKPDHGDARLAYTALLQRSGRADQANRSIEQWMTQDKGKADAYVLDAWRLRQNQALPHAQARLQQALELEPHNPRALTELAILYEQMNRPDRALVLYQRVLEEDPSRFEVKDRLASLRARGVKTPKMDQ